MAGNCKYKHCPLPYCWQFRTLNVDQWTSLSPSDNRGIEMRYCDVDSLEVSVNLSSQGLDTTATINLEQMTMQDGSTQFLLRRLSTPSYIQARGKKLATKWTWYWKDDNGWKEYAGKKITQENIETAYLSEEQDVYFFHRNKFIYMITFYEKSMYQRNMDRRYSTKRCVRRRPQFVAESELQSQTCLSNLMSSITVRWTTFLHRVSGQDTDFIRIPLASDNEEFKVVWKLFRRTIPFHKAQITGVQKIKNHFLLERYERKRYQMEKKFKASSDQLEKQLFHGTTSEVINAICKQNFDHRLHGKNGTKYGEGSYFALEASYSNNYSSGKTRFMFVARVLTGEYKLGNASLRRPPLKDPSNPASDLYDSCVDSEDKPKIFVIFNDEQCYPDYLITYIVP